MVPRETPSPDDLQARLAVYADLVRRFATRLDLVSPSSLLTFEERHIGDSLKALPVIDGLPPGPAVDVGSGAGLPGIPLALARPDRPWTLVEPRSGRAAFLEEAVRTLGADVEVVCARVEDLGPSFGTFTVATARAVAAPDEAISLLSPLVGIHGTIVLWIGASAVRPPGSAEPVPGIVTIKPSSPKEMEGNG
ncbi:MAG TPA: RsmG family class I SAM-dependent methyltransferase [Actinomycetota bacterium]|nr:RsmG family class I SAM-dependent methyltransferase [Actinomycetota bacterium]